MGAGSARKRKAWDFVTWALLAAPADEKRSRRDVAMQWAGLYLSDNLARVHVRKFEEWRLVHGQTKQSR